MDRLAARRIALCLTAFTFLGYGLRAWHFMRNDPVWHDEAALIVNVLHKSYGEIWGPRFFEETGPPLFLALEKAVASVLGDSAMSFRLVPLAAGFAAFFLTLRAARKLAAPIEVAVLAFAFGLSDRLLWHCTEAKPYSTDVLTAAAMFVLFVRFDRREPSLAEGLLLAALAPLIFFSYPLVFLLGGYAIARLPALRTRGSPGAWIGAALFACALGACVYGLTVGPVRAIRTAGLDRCWQEMFPDYEQWWFVPCVGIQRTWEAFRYALEPVGHVVMPFAAWGVVVLRRRGQGSAALFLLAPLGLNVLAWLVGKYPLGATRVVAYLAPALLTLIAIGVGDLFPKALRAWGRWGWVVPLPLGGAAILAAAALVLPWRRLEIAQPAGMVLARRAPDEPIVAWYWEHHYYFRSVAPWRIDAPPPVDDPNVRSFWYLHHWTTKKHHMQDPFWPLPHASSSEWTTESHRFRDYVVCRFVRTSVQARSRKTAPSGD